MDIFSFLLCFSHLSLVLLWLIQYLREDLSRIDESWATTRFDSLPHVVHILTSKDREGEAQFLKEQSDIIEEVVDEVVHAYHSGFNKAIQNYSQVSSSSSLIIIVLVLGLLVLVLGLGLLILVVVVVLIIIISSSFEHIDFLFIAY